MSNNVYAELSQNIDILEDAKQNESAYLEEWKSIPWKKIEQSIYKLQCDIACAEIDENYRKARNLQRILLSKDSALLYSIKRVTMFNRGYKTPGVDGMIIKSHPERMALFYNLKSKNFREYKPLPSRRVYIDKANGKKRPLGIPTLIDRVYQKVVSLALEPRVEVSFEPSSYGFRPMRNAGHAIARIRHYTRKGGRPWIFEGDFKSCFDTLNHDWILKQLGNFPAKNIVQKWLKAGYLYNDMLDITDEGTPQGGIISPLLANVALTGMEEALGIKYNKYKDRNTYTYRNQSRYAMIRYADDFVVLCKTKEDAKQVYSLLEPYLSERGLTLAPDKTMITHINDGFNFLGFNIRGYQTEQGLKVLNKPAKDRIKRLKTKLKALFIKYRSDNIEELIKRVNSTIIGTANYWKQGVAKKAFGEVDNYIWTLIVQYLRRQHPNKSWKWIKTKYFKEDYSQRHKDNYIFTCPDNPKIQLIKMSWIHINYARMIKYNCNPYDPEYTEYIKKQFKRTPFEYLYCKDKY